MSNSSTLFETEQYMVTIGVSPFVGVLEGRPEIPSAYLITNKNNGVVEGEHRVFGMAIRMCKEAQDLLNAETSSNSPEDKQKAVAEVPELGAPEPTN